MIKNIKIQNFKNIRDQKIDLGRLTVFVGANSSGKTSVLEAIHYATVAAGGDPSKVFGYERHCDWLYTRGGKGDLQLACETKHGIFSVTASSASILGFAADSHESLGKGKWHFEIAQNSDDLRRVLGPARSIVFLHLVSSNLAKSSYSDQQPPRVEYDGTGLASVLAYMKLSDDEGFERLEGYMREFVPQFKKIRIRKTEVRREEIEYVRIDNDTIQRKSTRTYQGEELLFDFENAANLSAHTISEGTLMLLGMLAVLMGPSPPSVLLLDDFEHGLHPLAQKHLLDVLRRILDRFPELQIVATAHSPYLLDALQPDEIRIVTRNRDGYSVFGKLSQHPQFDKWKDEMAPGEMWSMFTEDWVAEYLDDVESKLVPLITGAT